MSPSLLACPRCHTSLDVDGHDSVQCGHCGKDFHKAADGFWDFRDGDAFVDWFADDERAMATFRSTSQTIESHGSRRLIDAYLAPLLVRLGIQPGSARGLSDGCGIGVDVERLTDLGYEMWGGDPGARSEFWQERRCAAQLLRFNGVALPFASGAFDFVFSDGVLEHVGVRTDVHPRLSDRAQLDEERAQYCREIERVLRPGGYAIIAAPNRLFPVDFFHGGRPAPGGVSVRFHPPSDPFLVSAGDVERWFGRVGCGTRSLSLSNFFNLTPLASRGMLPRLVERSWSLAVAVCPPSLSARFSPYFVSLVGKPA